MGLLFVSLSPHCGLHGPHNPQRELGPWEPGRCFTKSRAAGPESTGHKGVTVSLVAPGCMEGHSVRPPTPQLQDRSSQGGGAGQGTADMCMMPPVSLGGMVRAL